MPDGAESTGTPGGLRRAREALLLDLGALVYELHRRGRRAPELLQEKASELGALDDRLDGETVGEPGPPACPACGAEAEPRQLVCTSCGARLTLGRSQSRNVAVLAVLAAVIAVGAGASGFALSEITSDDGDGAVPPAAQAPPQQAPAAAAGEPQEATQGSGTAPEAPTPEPPAEPRSLLLDWPADLTAHTVVLVSSSDRPAALRVARAAARSGIEAGMLRSDDYNLGTGLWIVFAGRFDTAEGASRQASGLAERYPGAYPQLVEPSG